MVHRTGEGQPVGKDAVRADQGHFFIDEEHPLVLKPPTNRYNYVRNDTPLNHPGYSTEASDGDTAVAVRVRIGGSAARTAYPPIRAVPPT
jgi:hypothetical protein